MKHKKLVFLAAFLPITSVLSACQDEAHETVSVQPATTAVAGKPTPTNADSGMASTGKPSAPISMRYEVVGTAVVGSPVSINVEIDTIGEHGPVQVEYSIADSSALVFQEGQVRRMRVSERTDRTKRSPQQMTVIPQREGRLYVNVSAEVQTPGGMMIKSMAIPIQVGNAPKKPQINGELVEGPDGETVISMPAKENQ